MPSVSNILAQAAIGQYLAQKEYGRNLVFKGASVVPLKRVARLIYIYRKTLEYIYSVSPNDPNLIPVANDLYWLVGIYNAKAANIIAGGGTGIIVNPGTGTESTILPYYLQFVVGEPDAPMNAGDTVLVISLTGFLENSVDIALDGTDLPQNRTDRWSFTVDYSNPAQITITFNQGLQGVTNGQLFEIRGMRWQAVVPPTSNTSETFIVVETYADMLAQSTGPFYKRFLVKNDENKGQTETTYDYWPDQEISWNAEVEDTNLNP